MNSLSFPPNPRAFLEQGTAASVKFVWAMELLKAQKPSQHINIHPCGWASLPVYVLASSSQGAGIAWLLYKHRRKSRDVGGSFYVFLEVMWEQLWRRWEPHCPGGRGFFQTLFQLCFVTKTHYHLHQMMELITNVDYLFFSLPRIYSCNFKVHVEYGWKKHFAGPSEYLAGSCLILSIWLSVRKIEA